MAEAEPPARTISLGTGVAAIIPAKPGQPRAAACGWLSVARTGPSTARSIPRVPARVRSAGSWQDAATSGKGGRPAASRVLAA